MKPSPRIAPLPPEHTPELKDAFDAMAKNLGFVPNSMLILQRKPKIARALAQLTASERRQARTLVDHDEVDRRSDASHLPPC